jgi:hypothetical protein
VEICSYNFTGPASLGILDYSYILVHKILSTLSVLRELYFFGSYSIIILTRRGQGGIRCGGNYSKRSCAVTLSRILFQIYNQLTNIPMLGTNEFLVYFDRVRTHIFVKILGNTQLGALPPPPITTYLLMKNRENP